MSLLNNIHSPEQLKSFSIDELESLCAEIRQTIVHTVAKNSGHLGSSLGVTELTVALHSVFSAPYDKILWDTGHQSYVHKLLTGRKDRFSSIRQYKGISGFPTRSESEYDVFGVGHASTSISAGYGIAVARDLNHEKFKVVSVISDGSLTGGISYEGLQNLGASNRDMIVILNDNQMFISHRIGAMGAYLTKLLTLGFVTKWEKKIENFLTKIHAFGSTLVHFSKRLRVLLFPGLLFEELGFTYFGPVYGHDIKQLRTALLAIKNIQSPVLLHVVTRKGKGFDYSEEDPFGWHAPGKFDVKSGVLEKRDGKVLSYTDVFSQTLFNLSKKDKKIITVTAAMPDGTGTANIQKYLPEQFFDVGLAEQHAVTFAGGLATEGLRPVVAIYSTFLQRGFDQLLHDIALQNLPVVFILDRSGLVGDDGPTHHGVFDYSYIRLIPNFIFMAPKDENELQHMVYTSIYYNDGPVAIRYPKGDALCGIGLDSQYSAIEIGKGEIVVDVPSSKIALISIGSMVHPSIDIAEEINQEGYAVCVVNMRFIKPIDTQLLVTLIKRGIDTFVTVEENVLSGGFGSAIMEATENMRVKKIHRIGIQDRFTEHGPIDILKKVENLSKEQIKKKVLSVIKANGE